MKLTAFLLACFYLASAYGVACFLSWSPALNTAIVAQELDATTSLDRKGSLSRDQLESSGIDFNRDVKPILSNHCFACHGNDANSRQAELRLDIKEAAMGELDSGEGFAIIAGKPDESLLVQRVFSTEKSMQMPPPSFNKPLTDHQKQILKSWIEQGAIWNQHWAYQPLQRPSIPRSKERYGNPIDSFVHHRAAQFQQLPRPKSLPGVSRNLEIGPSASHQTLVRRLHLDLVGLPPGKVVDIPPAVDLDQQNYERLVDRLLGHPAFGEKIASYWLDLVRYADTVGYHGDQEHNIAPYRDWVIKSFNDNQPFDQFTIEQLAGDLLTNPSEGQLIATGYNRLLQTTHEGGAQNQEYLSKYFSDRVRNLSDVWFGATVGCAECHDHKFDPIPQRDFYRLGSFFADIKEQGAYASPNSSPTTRPPELKVLSPLIRQRIAQLLLEKRSIQFTNKKNQLEAKQSDYSLMTEQLRSIDTHLESLRRQTISTMITVATKPRPIRVLHRGDWMDESGTIVTPGGLSIFAEIKRDDDARLNRLDLARWIVSRENPLTARVMANRLWFLCFGEGLYRTMEETGAQGSAPTHPELLDWLASELIESGWDIKHTLKLIVTSKTYRQRSTRLPYEQLDPENRLFLRQNQYRISAETIRDQALSVSGLLNVSMGGIAAKPYQPSGYYAHLNFPQRKYKSHKDSNQYRRGVYVHWQRQFLHPMLKAFDAPSREECTAKRHESNTPLAALALLNDPSFVEFARHFAQRAMVRTNEPTERIRWMWNELLYRQPEQLETQLMLAFVKRQTEHYNANPSLAAKLMSVGNSGYDQSISRTELAAWTFVARSLLNLHESLTRD